MALRCSLALSPDMPSTSILFVDDDPNLRMTLPAILEKEGFAVTAAGSVAEAVDLINKQKFDGLISDLNIGEPGDGFTVVSVMRRVQPDAITLILTGYPDFESALLAIRSQADDYLVKPADIPSLVANLRSKLAAHKPARFPPKRRIPELLLDNLDNILQRWLAAISEHPGFKKRSSQEWIDHVPGLLAGICARVISGGNGLDDETRHLAREHGLSRYQLHCPPEFIVSEARLLQREVVLLLQENLLVIELSMLIPDAMKIGDFFAEAAEESIRAFNQHSLAA